MDVGDYLKELSFEDFDTGIVGIIHIAKDVRFVVVMCDNGSGCSLR